MSRPLPAVAAAKATAADDARRPRRPQPLHESWRLFGLAARVLVSHCLAAALAEKVFTREGFDFPGAYGAVEAVIMALMAAIWALRRGQRAARKLLEATSRSELRRYALCGCAMAVHHGTGLAAMCRVNYTTAMLFTAARLPSVMLVGALVNPTASRPAHAAYVSAVCVGVGLALFGLAESELAPRFSNSGLLLIAANLVLGAGVFNLQQRVLQSGACRQEATDVESAAGRRASTRASEDATAVFMAVQYSTCAALFAAFSTGSGELGAFVGWCREHESTMQRELAPVVVGAMLTSVGVSALLRITVEFDATRASMATSWRKACTFCLSLMFFPKAFGALHGLGLTLTVLGSVGVQRSMRPAAAARQK